MSSIIHSRKCCIWNRLSLIFFEIVSRYLKSVAIIMLPQDNLMFFFFSWLVMLFKITAMICECEQLTTIINLFFIVIRYFVITILESFQYYFISKHFLSHKRQLTWKRQESNKKKWQNFRIEFIVYMQSNKI